MLGRKLVEGHQGFFVVGYLRHRLIRPLGRKLVGECLDGAYGARPVLGLGDPPDRLLRPPMDALGQGIEYVRGFMDPISLMSSFRKTSLTAAQKPSAPSPTARTGGRIPRFLRSRNNSAHDSSDSR